MIDNPAAEGATAQLPASSSETEPLPASTSVAATSIFGRSVTLIRGENARDFDELSRAISDAVMPADIFERIWINDFIELAWDSLRLRRLKTNLLASALVKGVEAILLSHANWRESSDFARRWAMGERSAVELVEGAFRAAGLKIDAAMAQALAIKIDVVESIDNMILKNEVRRNAVLREIEAHRAGLGLKLRKFAEQVEDAEVAVIDPDPANTGTGT